ncbi:conserved unknown protein [Ectocarpus siliculosus]|uniref:Chorein N-terminal domain-containing protein n=1 Tax=Ectocarpus siliculosus TaxID=2880 RepID=D8LBD2_ECTSI|nr:conserved unknown protein [Ectocarpus siliculosus]|eukprot:CBN76641.1 conserved unknown protein [Ectocarpus siliculosus]
MRVLQQQLSKYIHNIELEELGLMGGDVVLENLELRKDVLHDIGGISTDYDFSRGFIKELRIHIPWTRLQSRPIEIKVKTVEIIITPITHAASHRPSTRRSRTGPHSRHGGRSTDEQAAPAGVSGWMQQLLTKVLANMSIEVSNLVLKYEDADVVLSAALKSLVCFSADPDREWTPAFASLDDPFGFLHKLVHASDLTVCLDRYCAPDSSRRRQVQAFEVPILNRASFEVQLLACVWLVAPGPPESSFAAWEDQQTQQGERLEDTDYGAAGVPPSPGRAGARWGLQWGAGEGPRSPPVPRTARPPVTVLGRLVGGGTGGADDSTSVVDRAGSGATPTSAEPEGEIDELPIPTVCRLLGDGWSRRPSSLYSPFFDGEGAWSRNEASEVSSEGVRPSIPRDGEDRGGEEEDGAGVGVGGGHGEGRTMPIPIITANVLIADLSFSLSDLQVRMMKELIDRAVAHVALNARRNTHAESPIQGAPPSAAVEGEAPVASSWWPSFWRGTAPEGIDEGLPEGGTETTSTDMNHGTLGTSSPAPFESREDHTKFVVASASVGSVSLRLLEHQEQPAHAKPKEREEEEECNSPEDEEPLSISVPVHGLGTVSVFSTPVSARKQTLRPPVVFVVAEMKGLALDAHVLPSDNELSTDVKVDVSSIVVRHARLFEDAATPAADKPPDQADKGLDYLEPVVSWGAAVMPDAPPTSHEGDLRSGRTDGLADLRTAKIVQRCLIELAQGSPELGAADGESIDGERNSSRQSARAPAPDVPAPAPAPWAPVFPSAAPRPVPKDSSALQYRLLKRKGGGTSTDGSPDGGGVAITGTVSTLACHDLAVGALRVQLAEMLLEKLLKFSGVVGGEAGGTEPVGGDPGGEDEATAPPLTIAPVALASVHGRPPPRASRLSPRASDAGSGSALSSPRTLPPCPVTSSSETSLHFALRSVEVALGFAGGAHEADENGGDRSRDQPTFCVLSLSQLEISGSESASYVGEGGEQHFVATAPQRQRDEESQRLCSLVLGNLSIVLIDVSVQSADESAPLGRQGSPPLMSRSLAQEVFLAGGNPAGIRRLLRLGGARVTAEILSKLVGDTEPTAVGTYSAPDFLFNASLESGEVCVSVGAALLVLEAYVLARKMGGVYPDALSISVGGISAPRVHRNRGWSRGVGAVLEGVSVGGVVKSGGCQLTGNMRRLSVGRVGGGVPLQGESFVMPSDVVVLEALRGEGSDEGLSWTLEVSSDSAGGGGVKLATVFKSAKLHYTNAKKVVEEIMLVSKEWTARAARRVPSATAAARRRSQPFEFDIRGSAVTLHLPFELELEVEDVHLGTPGFNQAVEPEGERADGDLDLDIVAGDVRVFHKPHGSGFSSSEDAGPPAIRCAARGVVAVRPTANATAVSLESEHVRVRLTPAFCSSFGLFVRLMVGPPPRPLAADAAAAALMREGRPPTSFTFELKHATAAGAPGAGSRASFQMSFEAVEATQRRDPSRNAPALPYEAAQLIGAFVGHGGAPGVFSAWLSARKRPGGSSQAGPTYVQPFLVALGPSSATAQVFSVVSTSSGPRHRLVNSLSLRLAPMMLAWYPPTFRILMGHYNRFAANAFRSFRSRADMPRRRIAVLSYDIDIQGCSAVLLASLADGARGVHLSAGKVTFKEDTAAAAAAASPAGMGGSHASSSALAVDAPIAPDTTLAMSGFVGPVGMAFLQDWRSILPTSVAPSAGGRLDGDAAAAPVQLCAPIDLRWAMFYDELDRCRQDVSLSSVQFCLEQPHFDLCVRVAQIFVAADYPGALPPAVVAPQIAGHPQDPVRGAPVGGVTNNAQVDSFLATSLRLPLLQFVLANGKRSGSFPPVLEIDVASVRLARGGVLTVRHLSVNSWSQDADSPARSEAAAGEIGNENDGSGCGYRVLGRSGQSEESGKDFLRMEVRVPEVRSGKLGPRQAQLDVVLQVQPFDIHVNPSILRSFTAYIAPVPFVEGSPEEEEVPFPQRQPLLTISCHSSSSNPHTSATRDGDGAAGDRAAGGIERASSSGQRVSTNFEKSALTASGSVRVLASQVTLELSSYPGGPAFMASTSHVFLRAITWPSDAAARGSSGEGGVQAGPEVFARLSRVECRVKCGQESGGSAATVQNRARVGPSSQPDDQLGDTVLKPFDVDVHLTRPGASSAGGVAALAAGVTAATSEHPVTQGWHAGVYVDELYLRCAPLHVRSLELLSDLFLPAVTAAELTAVELGRGGRARGTASDLQGLAGGRRIDDLAALDRVECQEPAGHADAVKPGPGQAVFYGVGTTPQGGRPRQGVGSSSDGAGASGVAGEEKEAGRRKEGEEEGRGGWVHCCEWRYWGLRRVAQVALPRLPLCGSVPLLEGLAVTSLEVELSFVDPLTETVKAATRFNVPCQAPNGSSDDFVLAGGSRVTIEPSQPILARTWRLSWRVPTWLRFKAAGAGGAPKPPAISAWSSALLRTLSIRSSPAGPVVGPSYVSATLVAQRLTLALLTEGGPISRSSSAAAAAAVAPPVSPSRRREGLGLFVQPEEIVRVVVADVNFFAEASLAGRWLSVAARGSAVVAADVQDFSNFLRLPLLSHAAVKLDVSTSSGRGGTGRMVGEGESLLSPFRPIASGAVDVSGAVVSVSVTAMQCIEQCIAELTRRPSDEPATRPSTTTAEAKPSAVAVPAPVPPPRQPRQRSKRYIITNHTDRNLWFGQVSTTETLFLRAGEETLYRWRTIPHTLAAGAAGRKGDDASRLVLMLRLALHRVSGSGGGYAGAGSEHGGGYGTWTEPFPVDHVGTFKRLLRGAEAEGQVGADASARGAGHQESDFVTLPLWVEVVKNGLETRIAFHGEWVFTNYLPQEIQVAWVTSAGVGNAGRCLVEPAGTRGGLSLEACATSGRAGGSNHPVSCSALTASSSSPGAGQAHGERLSELMLEFRLSTPDAAAFVGSVGPPPVATEHSAGHPAAARDAGGFADGGSFDSRGLDDELLQGREEIEVDSSGSPWEVTRQSEWVQARPFVFLALISCASTDPGISGFAFWCVASRQASRAANGHRGNLGQMRIDLHPMALVWNGSSIPMRAVLKHRSGGGGWPEQPPATLAEAVDEQGGAGGGHAADRNDDPRANYSLSRTTSAIRPGGRTAVCQRPFVDYDLAVASTGTAARQASPFLVSVPAELLSRRPLLGSDGEPSAQQPAEAPVTERGEPERAQTEEEEEQATAPLLRRRGSESLSVDDGGEAGSGRRAVARVSRVFRAGAESCHSAWDMFHGSEGFSIPFLLPHVSLDIGLDSPEEVSPSPATASACAGWSSLVPPGRSAEEVPGGPTPPTPAERRSRKLKVSLAEELNELLLVPWEASSGVVLPVLATLEREVVLGGVELIRLALYPRVVVHNATGVPVSLSLLGGAHAAAEDDKPGGGARNEALPMCRVRLTPEGSGSRMNLLAIPGERALHGLDTSLHGSPRSAAGGGEGGRAGEGRGFPLENNPPPGLLGKLSRILSSGSYKASSAHPAGFSADLEMAFGWDDRADQASADGSGAVDGRGAPPTARPAGEEAASTGATKWSQEGCGVNELPVFSLCEPSAGSALASHPSSLTVPGGGQRAVRVYVAVEPPGAEPTSAASLTRHVLIYRDPQPDLTICNRSTDTVTLLLDCGALVEVAPGGTVEHSWRKEPTTRDANGSNGGGGGGGGGSASAAPRSSRNHHPPPPPVLRFDGQIGINEESWGHRGIAEGGGGEDGGGGDDEREGFGTRSAREVQVHVVERAGGFVMSFAEGGFEGAAADGVGVVDSGARDNHHLESRGVLGRWASTLEQHVVVTLSGVSLQLLDDSNLQAVAANGQGGKSTAAAARAASERLGGMDGWVGGTWAEPGGLPSDGASAHLPAAAIPAIVSVFVDASSTRLWRAAPAVRPGMSSLDLERSWHLKDRVGIDVCLGTLQIDSHVAGHRLPVIFCFRKGGRLVQVNEIGMGMPGDDQVKGDCRLAMSLVLAESWEDSRVPSYLEKVSIHSAPIDVCFEDSLLPPLLLLLERSGIGAASPGDRSSPYPFAASANDRGPGSSAAQGGLPSKRSPQLLPPALGASVVPRLFIQRVDIGALVVRATVQGYIPGKQVFLALDKSPLLFRPVSLRGVLARPDEIAEQIASNYAVDALLRSLAVVGSLEALGSPTTLLSEWGKGVYDLFAMPIKAMPQGPSSTFRATFRGVSSLLRHASAGTLSSVSGVSNALSRNLGGRGGVVRPIAGTMGLVHRTSKSLIASTGVDSEWTHAEANTAANPATAYLNADLWYRCCLLPAGHEFLYRTPALCSNASYSQANVPVTIVLSSKAVFLYRGGSGCETLWKQIDHQDITLVEQSAEHAPAELILNVRLGSAQCTTRMHAVPLWFNGILEWAVGTTVTISLYRWVVNMMCLRFS